MTEKLPKAVRLAARLGLIARGVFYLLLSGLVVAVAVTRGRTGQQANAHGALSVIAQNWLGLAAIVATSAGFAAFGLVRIAGAVRHTRPPIWRRITTGLQGAFYCFLAWVPLSFALGHHQTGSEQQQHKETAVILSWPLGRELVAAVGVIVVIVCGWQIRTALTRGFDDGLELGGQPHWVRRLAIIVGVVGIAARALVFVPVGVFLVIAAVRVSPSHADGLDLELARLSHQPWGPLVLFGVAAGLALFALYSGFEARFRRLDAGV